MIVAPESGLHDLRYPSRPSKRVAARRCAALARPAVQRGHGGAAQPCRGLAATLPAVQDVAPF
ncbi:MAG TPA: hypothetical protein ENI62_07865 [Gammaproteobacteria bacterium]|nr:hypothetical protein [Gammaproteobacteria bacterium]